MLAKDGSASFQSLVRLTDPIEKQQACVLVVFTYSSVSNGVRNGRFYSQNVRWCYTYQPPQAAQGFFEGSGLFGVIAAGAALAVLVTVLLVVLIRRRRAAAAKARKEKADALRPRPQIEVIWDRNGMPIINPGPDQQTYEVPVGGYEKKREDGTYAIYNDDGTYAQYEGIGGRHDSVYDATYEDTYDEQIGPDAEVNCSLSIFAFFINCRVTTRMIRWLAKARRSARRSLLNFLHR